MKIYSELMYIVGFAFLGQIISKFLNIPIPGSVIGLVLFFICLKIELIALEKVEKTAKFLTDNLALLFIPAAIGIITKIDDIKDIWLIIFFICFITTIISLIFVGLLTKYLIKRGDKNDRNNSK